ncbi:MAG: pantetheine-phosphate adenylyltransferase [Legionellales bacterium]|jgi:pantetheine-phosphate adenylyltransferase|nr:pantetheine-phosphate adenylyltransferase [Legionellales bacterium]
MMRAVFPGSFNPITFGHLDLITRAASLCDSVVVVVSFSAGHAEPEDRLELVKLACQNISNVEVVSYQGLMVDCAKDEGANVIIRGVRSGDDLCYENNMANMNRQLGDDIETLLLPADANLSHISSSLVRQILRVQADAAPFVPADVLKCIRDKNIYGT